MEYKPVVTESLFDKLKSYKRKYYSNQLIRGSICFLALLFGTYLLINTLEYFGRFNTVIRTLLFFSFLSIVLASLAYWLLTPLTKLYNLNKQISNEEAARQIGSYFRDINDKLLNTLQLNTLNHQQSELLKASIEQKSRELSVIRFNDAIDVRENNKYLKFLFAPAFLILSILFVYPRFFSESSTRLVNFKNEYAPPAPFSFLLQNQLLTAFKDEEFPVNLLLKGEAIPDAVYLVSNGRRYQMQPSDRSNFNYNFNRVQTSFSFHFEAAGFRSADYRVQMIERPNLKSFNAYLSYPAYLNKADESLNNVGNLVVPDGTRVRWEFSAVGTDSLYVDFESTVRLPAEKKNAALFEFSRQMRKSENYQVFLKNRITNNRDKINYYVSVIPDKFPQISLEQYQDTALFNFLILGGNIMDDYGISQLKVFYRIMREGDTNESKPYASRNIQFDRKQLFQNFYYQWKLDSLTLKAGDRIQYYVQVWDNDGVNGSKSSKSLSSQFNIPSKSEMQENIKHTADKTENQISQAISQVQKLKKDMSNLENRLKNKKQLDFQDKKLAEDLIKRREDLKKEIESLQKQNESLQDKQQKFSQQSQEMAEKAKQLNKLMNELLDEETKKLYDELQKLLEQNRNNSEMLDILDKIDNKENNLKKELERALEMFKQMQLEQKADNIIQELKENAQKQEDLSEKSLEKNANKEDLLDKQQQLNEKFDETKEDLKELEKMNEEMAHPQPLEDNKEEQKSISEEQQKSIDQLQQKQNKKASDAQKKAAQKMTEMADKLSKMQEGQEMEQMEENLKDLRNILENLLTLSFEQEKLMKDFREVNQSDPRFVSLSQQQLKLKDDARIVDDSLTSLAKRVFQIESFVTREVSAMNQYMDLSVESIKQRRLNAATGKQQFAMTSMNNLALMLNDVLKQMQQQMADAKPSKSKNKKKGQSKSPSLGDLQKQLNDQIQQLKQGNKTGRQLSEELSKLALEQEMIRKALQELEKSSKGKPGTGEMGSKLSEIQKQMEETEKELVNKKLSQNTLNRQKDILTRLLESEKAAREREEDIQRKAETAKETPKNVPSQFQDYILIKQQQIELLKTVPPSLSPYYKKEVDKYFNKIRRTTN
jgi:hypothetical protein